MNNYYYYYYFALQQLLCVRVCVYYGRETSMTAQTFVECVLLAHYVKLAYFLQHTPNRLARARVRV